MTNASEFNQLVQTRFGPMLCNKHDVYIGRSLSYYGEFSLGEKQLFDQFLRPGDFVVEAGANIGALTVPIAQRVTSAGRVYAFEPQRIVFQTLCANLALNNLANVFAVQAGLGAETGQTLLPELDHAHQNNFGGLSLLGHQQGELAAIETIDRLELKRCRMIKIDVEGMEMDVLRGAEQTIARCKPILYAEADREEQVSELFRYIDSLNYKIYRHSPPLFDSGNHNRVTENIFGQLVSKNVLCIHKSVQQVIDGAEPIAI